MLISRDFIPASIRALAVALIGTITTGCFTTTLVPPSEATRLSVDALSFPGELRAVHDVDGEIVVLGESFSVKVEPRADLPPEWAMWSATAPPIKSPVAVTVRGPMLLLQGKEELAATQIPLAYVQRLRVREYSHGKTAGLAIGVTVAVGVLAILLAFSLGAESSSIE